MAQMIREQENSTGEGVIQWAMDHIADISPTIKQAERKLNGVLDAANIKYKRM